MHSIKIISTQAEYSTADKKDVLVVTVEVFQALEEQEQVSLGLRKFSYPLETAEDQILADLAKYKETLNSDFAVAQESEKLETDLANIDQLSQSLTGQIL